MNNEFSNLSVDVAIVGGGIAGLWTLARLRKKGINAVLFEKDTLGCQQTLASQGIIHGGLKYSLQGFLSKSTQAISGMPQRWLDAIAGTGEIDLTGAKVLSDAQYMFSSGSLESRVSNFFASRAVGGSTQQITDITQTPQVFQNKAFNGSLYRLNEPVLNVVSVIKCLLDNHHQHIFKADVQLVKQELGYDLLLENQLSLQADNIILAAGAGNQALLSANGLDIKMQRRPLHMLAVEHDFPHHVYAHCIDASSTPKLTITSYKKKEGRYIWYLGGEIAESGVSVDSSKLIETAQQLLADLFPWLSLGNANWHSFKIDRAEAKTKNLLRPTSVYANKQDNLIITWPTKLALSPLLADKVEDFLSIDKLQNSSVNNMDQGKLYDVLHQHFATPKVAVPPWFMD